MSVFLEPKFILLPLSFTLHKVKIDFVILFYEGRCFSFVLIEAESNRKQFLIPVVFNNVLPFLHFLLSIIIIELVLLQSYTIENATYKVSLNVIKHTIDVKGSEDHH